MGEEQFRVLLFGVGSIGSKHLNAIKLHPRFTMTAIVETNPERARIGEKNGIPTFGSLEEAKAIEFDCAIIASPTATHIPIIESLIALKKPFLVEKPFAFDLSDALRIKELVEKSHLPCAVGYSERCNPLAQHLKKFLFDPSFGEMHWMKIIRCSTARAENSNCDKNNVIFDLAVHDFDLLKYFFGTITLQSATNFPMNGSKKIGKADFSIRNCKCSDIQVQTEWLTDLMKPERGYIIQYERACMEVDFLAKTLQIFDLSTSVGDSIQKKQLRESLNTANEPQSLEVQLGEFYKLLTGDTHLLATIDDGLAAIQLAQEAALTATVPALAPHASSNASF